MVGKNYTTPDWLVPMKENKNVQLIADWFKPSNIPIKGS